jgi:hypothetical protein
LPDLNAKLIAARQQLEIMIETVRHAERDL